MPIYSLVYESQLISVARLYCRVRRANFRPADRWNRKSQIIPKLGRILKFKPQQSYKLIKILLLTENEGKLGFELWPRFANFARFFCAFALKRLKIVNLHYVFKINAILILCSDNSFVKLFYSATTKGPVKKYRGWGWSCNMPKRGGRPFIFSLQHFPLLQLTPSGTFCPVPKPQEFDRLRSLYIIIRRTHEVS